MLFFKSRLARARHRGVRAHERVLNQLVSRAVSAASQPQFPATPGSTLVRTTAHVSCQSGASRCLVSTEGWWKEPMADNASSEGAVGGGQTVGHDAATQERRRGREDIPPDIIAAARKNFLRYGVNRTTMTDIARAVGMPRQTLYSYVASRDDLVDAVLVLRIQEIAEDLKPIGDEDISFDEALVETSLAAVKRARNDPELMNIFTTGPAERVQDVVTGNYPEIQSIVSNLLGPILDRGEQVDKVRKDKTRDEIVDWVRVVYLTLINERLGDDARERSFVADFLLPSIMFSRNDKAATS